MTLVWFRFILRVDTGMDFRRYKDNYVLFVFLSCDDISFKSICIMLGTSVWRVYLEAKPPYLPVRVLFAIG